MDIFIMLKAHDFYNEAQTMAQVFYPNGKYIRAESVSQTSVTILSALENGKCSAFIYEDGLFLRSFETQPASEDRGGIKNAVKAAIYCALSGITGYTPKWGILTGIRPAKLASAMLAEGKTKNEIIRTFQSKYFVSEEKARLAYLVAENSRRIVSAHTPPADSANLYAGIPFCPSRCMYCSFTSYSAESYEGRADYYLDCLEKELDALAPRPLSSVYIGGGTPTSLNDSRLLRLLSTIAEKFDTRGVEYTVEAGRPETITEKKLEIMNSFGVNRISVNPQTMNADTLKLVGRRHTPEDAARAFRLARAAGFDNINMDLIVGLPGETPETVKRTLDRISELEPDSITVHTLSVKRASRLNEELAAHALAKAPEIEEMLTLAAEYARSMKMFPYSMYRQKNMLGNFENVGWCREGKHSVFNVETLEETRTILAAGAGAVTKIVRGSKINRFFNVKNVDEYMERIDEIVINKSRALDAAAF